MVVLTAQLMLLLDTTIVMVALTDIDAELGFGPGMLPWVVTAYTLAFGGLLLTGGRLGDSFGKRRMFRIGIAVFTLASLAGSLAISPEWLITTRAVQGVGAALAAPGTLALISSSAPTEQARHRALALFSAVGIAGGAVGLVVGGAVTQAGSWRWVLLVNVPLGIAVVLLVARVVAETERRAGRFDVPGAVTATGAAAALVFAITGAPTRGWTSPVTLTALGAALLLAIAFVVIERRTSAPLVNPVLLRVPARVGALIVAAFVLGCQSSVLYLTLQHLQRGLGFSPLAAGLMFLPMTIGIFAMSRITPTLVARWGQRTCILIGTFGLAVSGAILSTLPAADASWIILAVMLLNGICAGFCFMPLTSLALGGVDPRDAGTASGMLQTTQNLGSAIAIATVTAVSAAAALAGTAENGLAPAFLTAGIIAALACITTAIAIRTPRPLAG